jgi:hypothetical protein
MEGDKTIMKDNETSNAASASPAPFWKGRKLWYAVLGIALLVTLELAGKIDLDSSQIMTVVMALIGTHTLSDLGHQLIAGRAQSSGESKNRETQNS